MKSTPLILAFVVSILFAAQGRAVTRDLQGRYQSALACLGGKAPHLLNDISNERIYAVTQEGATQFNVKDVSTFERDDADKGSFFYYDLKLEGAPGGTLVKQHYPFPQHEPRDSDAAPKKDPRPLPLEPADWNHVHGVPVDENGLPHVNDLLTKAIEKLKNPQQPLCTHATQQLDTHHLGGSAPHPTKSGATQNSVDPLQDNPLLKAADPGSKPGIGK